MKTIFLRGAQEEFDDAIDFYEASETGLGTKFNEAVEAAIARITEAPNRWREVECGVRRYVLARQFPYLIFYTPAGEELLIVAVSHASREPGYWRHRIG